MASTYTYRVRDRQGKLVTGSLQADNERLVISKLQEMGYVPVQVAEKKESLAGRELAFRPNHVRLKDLSVFSRQFATMVNSGLPILKALAILSEQTESKPLAKVVTEVRLDVERGSSLSQAMAKHPKVFQNLYVAMIKAGETGGVLDSVLLRLPTRILLFCSDAFRKLWWIWILAAIGGTFAFKRYRATPQGRATIDAFKLKVPVFGGLFHKSA